MQALQPHEPKPCSYFNPYLRRQHEKYELLLYVCDTGDHISVEFHYGPGYENGEAGQTGETREYTIWDSFPHDEYGQIVFSAVWFAEQMAKNPPGIPLTSEERGQIQREAEEMVRELASVPPIVIETMHDYIEELRRKKTELIDEDPSLMEILRILCSAKKKMSGSDLGARLRVDKRTIVNKTRRLKELGLVETREKTKGIIPTREAFRLVEL